jgi:methylenetetrahydrofolate dehydrogenase (NADP+)/methenyltetrahydrofolate cyclohydrolase
MKGKHCMQEIKLYTESQKALIKARVAEMKTPPHIAIIQVGDVDASNRYVKNKIKDCEDCGIFCALFKYTSDISEEALLRAIEHLNQDKGISGFIVQLPLPSHINEQKIMKAIAPEKDLDGFNKQSNTKPATPFGIYSYLKDMNYDFVGKNAVVIGRSDIVGKPMASLLLKESMNITVIHSKTSKEDKHYFIKNADLIVVATGCRNTLDNSYEFKENAIIFDVGINLDDQNKLCGDCSKNLKVAFQSPVPGGVGLLTRLALIKNIFEL